MDQQSRRGVISPEDTTVASRAPVAVRYRVKVTPGLVWAIVAPYVWERLAEQIKALAPISVFLFAFQVLVSRQPVAGAAGVTLGLTCVVLGLMFFIEGLRVGVMPLGEHIGATLPARAGLTIILAAAFLLGTIATLAEPAVATLAVLGLHVRRTTPSVRAEA
jgi:hypothetical protein